MIPRRRILLSGGWLAAAAPLAGPAGLAQAQGAAGASALESQSQALQRASDAVLGVVVSALDGARSSASLGAVRLGSGVVIGDEGLVLTIGYLVLEAETVMLLPDDGRQVPARVVAYDLATGFGLVQALTPLRLAAVPLGASRGLSPQAPLVFISGGPQGSVSPVRLLERGPYSGSWEYHIDEALYTAPPRRDQSGAGLFDEAGRLVGIGSLFLGRAGTAADTGQPGNMFVPVDLLSPVLQELRSGGSSRASLRPWLGLNCVETAQGLRVVRVNEDSPADVAGVQPGDIVERIDGVSVQALSALWKTLWSRGPAEREVTLEVLRDGSRQTLAVYSVDRLKTFRREQGI